MKKIRCMAWSLFLSLAFVFSFCVPVSAEQVSNLDKSSTQIQASSLAVKGQKLNNDLLKGNYKRISLSKNLKSADGVSENSVSKKAVVNSLLPILLLWLDWNTMY